MAVTYNKINWDEETPITVANLDRIDVGIDEVVTQSNSNESRITTNEDDISNHEGRITTNEGDISNHEGRITTNESKLDTIQGSETVVDGRITNNENDISNLITIVDDGRWDVFSTTSIPSDIEVTFFITNSNFHLKYIDNENDNTYTHDTGISTGPIAANGRRFILFNAGWDSSTDFVNVRFTVFEISLP